jgi:hypothetical protein
MELKKSQVMERAHGAPMRLIDGLAATQDLDQQNEELILDGIDFSPYLQAGWVNWNHQEGPQFLLGKPLEACIKSVGGKRGLYNRVHLLDGYPGADAVWNLIEALEKSGWTDRRLGFSVQGGVTHRMQNRLLKSVVRHMAVTHEPVNAATFAQLCKSMTTGTGPGLLVGPPSPAVYPLYTPPLGPAHRGNGDALLVPGVGIAGTAPVGVVTPTLNGAGHPTLDHLALRMQGTSPDLTSILWGDCANPEVSCYNPATGQFHAGRSGALHHLVVCKSMAVTPAKEFLLKLVKSNLG